MLKRIALGLFVAAIGLTGISALRGRSVRADTPPDPRLLQHEVPVVKDNGQLKQAQKLPITQVVLFTSGVGYFHRSGDVEGNARIDLQFSAGDINDLIKSLVVHDTGGKSVPFRYDSQEPIEKTLKSFAIDLSTNPSHGQILNQMRGQKVEITLQTNNPALNGLPGSLTGTIVGMETAHRPHHPTAPAVAEMELLNLACAEGLRSVPLSAVQRVRFLNPSIENELRRALEVVAVGHDSQKKTVQLGFQGNGKREVRVGYVVESPIWKTSYRLTRSGDGKWRLQAWANVENTSDEDWNDVKLTLVSSRPISFQMDLYPPLFIPRPTVEPALFASLRPPTYAGPIAMNPPAGAAGFVGGFGGGFGGQQQNFGGQGFQGQAGQLFQGGQGVLGFGGGNMGQAGDVGSAAINGVNRYQVPINPDRGRRLTYDELRERRSGEMPQTESKSQARQIGSALANVDPDFIQQVEAAKELGHPARYTIDQKITLARQQSLMLPILDQEIEATKVSIYNQRVHEQHPLQGLKIKNKTKQALMSGPVTVYEGDQPYSGDARLLDLQPNEERYLSYALDSGVEIKSADVTRPGPESVIRLENNQLKVQYKLRHNRTYVIVNRSPESRRVVIEQPIETDWKLVQPKPSEVTRELYRFDVDVKANETVKYEVSEELPRIDPFMVTGQADWSGFATTLGLDVLVQEKRMPEDALLIQVIEFPYALQVTHKDRRATTYFVRNRDDEDRVVWLEHDVANERTLVGNRDQIEKGTNRYRYKLELKKGQTLSHTITEERRTAASERMALHTLAANPSAKPSEDEGPSQRFVTQLGFDVWQTRKTEPQALLGGRITKGELHTTAREVETVTYHIRDYSKANRTIILEHAVRAGWSPVGENRPGESSSRTRQYRIAVAASTRAQQSVTEERIAEKHESIMELKEERLHALVASPALKQPVKDGLKKAFEMRVTLSRTAAMLGDLRAEAKEISEEQSRLRTNMEKLPQTSELYKRYLAKLDQQETALELVQDRLKQKEGEQRKLTADLYQFLERLEAE
jgi:hypothetical protein